MSQDQRLLNYLRDNKQIDPLTSWKELGIYRLSACIYRLRKQGWEIKTGRKAVVNSHGESCVVALYEYIYTPVPNGLDGFTPNEINQAIPQKRYIILSGYET